MEPLEDHTSALWLRLWDLADQLESSDPDTLSRTMGGKTGDGRVGQMPWIDYHPLVHHIMRLLAELKVTQRVDWRAWKGDRKYGDVMGRDQIEIAGLDDLVYLFSMIVAAERVSEGTLASALRNGSFVALLTRLRTMVNS